MGTHFWGTTIKYTEVAIAISVDWQKFNTMNNVTGPVNSDFFWLHSLDTKVLISSTRLHLHLGVQVTGLRFLKKVSIRLLQCCLELHNKYLWVAKAWCCWIKSQLPTFHTHISSFGMKIVFTIPIICITTTKLYLTNAGDWALLFTMNQHLKTIGHYNHVPKEKCPSVVGPPKVWPWNPPCDTR